MRISDWSSDVCSSDLERCADGDRAGAGDGARADGLEQAAAVDGTALAGALFARVLFARVLFALSGHLMSSHVSIVDVFLIGTAPEYCAVYAVFVRPWQPACD